MAITTLKYDNTLPYIKSFQAKNIKSRCLAYCTTSLSSSLLWFNSNGVSEKKKLYSSNLCSFIVDVHHILS